MLRAPKFGPRVYGKRHGKSSRCWVQAWRFQSGSLHSAAFDKSPANDIRVNVKNGLNSPIAVRLIHPPAPEPNGPIILDLGSGKPLDRDRDEAYDLCSITNATIIRPSIHPTRSSPHPAPVHQTLAVFDWIWRELVGTAKATENPGRSKIGVLGELEAGGRAIMLALTECSPTRPHISAASVLNPILDWTDVFPEDREMVADDLKADSISQPQKTESTNGASIPSTSALMARRKEIFSKPEQFFDPFASPLLFFRSPCFDLPYKSPLIALPGSSKSSEGEMENKEESSPPLERRRTYERRYPNYGSDIVFPPTRLTISKDWMLKRQSFELQHVVGKSLLRLRQERNQATGEMSGGTSPVMVEEMDLSKSRNPSDILLAGKWLGEALRRP